MSRLTVKLRWLLLSCWLVAVVALAVWVRPLKEKTREEQASFLPAEVSTNRALDLLQEGFDQRARRSYVVVILESTDGPLTPDDVRRVTTSLQALQAEVDNIHEVLSSTVRPELLQLMAAPPDPDGQVRSQLIRISLDTVFVTRDTKQAVRAIKDRVDATLSDMRRGLVAHYIGDAILGDDYGRASDESLERMTLATIILVVAILLFIYRSPVAPLVSLMTIGVAYILSDRLLSLVASGGVVISPVVSHLMLVVIFGAGTDYCLFLMGRFREELAAGRSRFVAMHVALSRTTPAIVSSAVTTMLGLGLMAFARFRAFQTLGPCVAGSLGVTLLLAMTFAPAVSLMLGRIVFWPSDVKADHSSGLWSSVVDRIRKRDSLLRKAMAILATPWFATVWALGYLGHGLWDRVAHWVTRRPGLILLVVGLLASPWIVMGVWLDPSYDLMIELPDSMAFRKGFEAADRLGYPVHTFFPTTVVFTSRVDPSTGYGGTTLLMQPKVEPGSPAHRLQGVIDDLLQLTDDEGPVVKDVRSNINPLGRDHALPILQDDHIRQVNQTYVGKLDDNRWVGRVDVFLTEENPYSPHAKRQLEQLRRFMHRRMSQPPFDADEVATSGTTSTMADIRDVTSRDFYRVVLLVVAGVVVVLIVLLRGLATPLYLVGTMLLGNLTMLGVLSVVYGSESVDWKVRLFMFVLLIAIGVDYNIFLLTRIREEHRRHPYPVAVRRSITATGAIISSCGLIMAGTFSSMMLGTLLFLRQLGFAIMAGVLLDTFLIRPVVVPSLGLLWHRLTGRPRGRDAEVVQDETEG